MVRFPLISLHAPPGRELAEATQTFFTLLADKQGGSSWPDCSNRPIAYVIQWCLGLRSTFARRTRSLPGLAESSFISQVGGSSSLPFDMDLSDAFSTNLPAVMYVFMFPPDEVISTASAGTDGEGYLYKGSCLGVHGGVVCWSYECEPATAYKCNAADKCGECHWAPLSELEKPDCPDTTGFYWPARCVEKHLDAYDIKDMTDCVLPTGTTSLDVHEFVWTGSRGEYDCALTSLPLECKSEGPWVLSTTSLAAGTVGPMSA